MDLWSIGRGGVTVWHGSDRLTPHLCRDALNTTAAHLADLLAELPSPSLTIDLWKTTTLHQFHDGLTPPPPPINHRSMEDHYTKLGRSTGRYIYSTMHIYLWQIYPPPPPPIKHRYLEYDYTKLGTSNDRSIYIEQCTYTHSRLTPTSQSSIDALNTATPNLSHLYIWNSAYILMAY